MSADDAARRVEPGRGRAGTWLPARLPGRGRDTAGWDAAPDGDPATEPHDEHDGERDGVGDPAAPLPLLVSLHYLRAALRRRRRTVLVAAVAGLAAALAYATVVPGGHAATTTLVLAHDRDVEPARAMATDESLLQTRVVAERTVAALGLAMTPEAFLGSVTADPTTSDVLVLRLSAPSDAEAVRRLREFSTQYLSFRGAQVAAQSDVLIAGNNDRIATLTRQAGEVSRRIQQLSAGGVDPTGQLGDAITQRAQLNAQISTLEQAVQDATLDKASIVSASRVVDPAVAPTGGGMRRMALTLASGLIGGTALGAATVLIGAITSNRLRLRIDVAAALETPVPVSVGRLAPPSRLRRLLPLRRSRASAARDRDLERVAHVVEQSLPPAGREPQRLVMACVDNAPEACFALAAAGVALGRRGRAVRLVDLTEAGRLAAAVARLTPGSDIDRPPVDRPRTVPSLRPGPADDALPDGAPPDDGSPDGDSPDSGSPDVSLVLADLDPAFGAYHLTDWAPRVLVAVTGGLSTAERARTAGDLVRAAGLELCGALLLRADPRDASSGSFPAATSRTWIRPVPGREDRAR